MSSIAHIIRERRSPSNTAPWNLATSTKLANVYMGVSIETTYQSCALILNTDVV